MRASRLDRQARDGELACVPKNAYSDAQEGRFAFCCARVRPGPMLHSASD
jgi:hypothetical protein